MFESLKEALQGPVFTIFTPFDENYNIDYSSLRAYVDHLYMGGARIFYVMAYNSRFSQMTHQEIYDVNNFCTCYVKELSANNIIIVADPIHCSTKTSLEFAKSAKKSGADAISLLFREKYFNDRHVIDHYDFIGKNSDFPIVVHEMPFLSGMNGKQMNWPFSLLASIAELPYVVALKEDAKDMSIAKYALSLEPDVRIIFAGTKRTFLPLLDLGLKAYLNGISIIDAQIGIKFWEAVKSKDIDLVNFIVEKLEDPFFLGPVKKYGWHRCNKGLLQAHGLMHRRDRMPLESLNQDEYNDILRVHDQISAKLKFL